MRYILVLLILIPFGVSNASAQTREHKLKKILQHEHEFKKIYKHRQTTYSKCSLRAWRYGQDKTIGLAKVLAVADPAVDANLAGNGDTLEKRFHIPVSAVQTDRVSLGTIGVGFYSTGEAICTGILDHNGGVDGGLRGSNVTIRLRAYAGVPQVEDVADAITVFETSDDTWVFKNQPKSVTFGKLSGNQANQLKRFFQQITHIEIELEHTVDR